MSLRFQTHLQTTTLHNLKNHQPSSWYPWKASGTRKMTRRASTALKDHIFHAAVNVCCLQQHPISRTCDTRQVSNSQDHGCFITFWHGVHDECTRKQSKPVSTKCKYCLFDYANQLHYNELMTNTDSFHSFSISCTIEV